MKFTILMTLLALALAHAPAVAQVASYPYIQDFESGPGAWTSGGSLDSWAFGTPAKAVINSAASGVNCWVSGGLSGVYNNSEQSYVLGPNFSFATLSGPVIQLSVFWECEQVYDGAVLQSSIDNGMSWQNVGAFGDPNNWYNYVSIVGAPGGSQDGWSGSVSSGTGSGMWVTALHALDGLGGQPNVLLRIAFGTDGSVTYEGFAFDDVTVYDSPPLYPGTIGGDLQLGTGVNGAPTSGLGTFVKTATALDAISLGLISPMGTYDYQPYVILAQPFTTGSPPNPTIPGLVWLDLTQPYAILVNISPFLTKVLPPAGFKYTFIMPFGFAGQSFLFQAACPTPALSVTDGYEIGVM